MVALFERKALAHGMLLALLDYNPATGEFRRLRRTPGPQRQVAGWRDDGYIKIKVAGVTFYAHRLAWFWMTGRWPNGEIDHVNRVKDDNRWSNLRKATRTQNARNLGRKASNTTGLSGVSERTSGQYQAQICVDRNILHLGTYPEPEWAGIAYVLGSLAFHGEWGAANGSV